MKGYIYFIVNKVTKEYYVGQTTNYSRRKGEHLLKLKEGKHPNPKLQNSFNKYSEENFDFSYIKYDNIEKQELDELEKSYIREKNSYEKGFNLTLGGTGGNTRTNLKLDFDSYCFAYFGNREYQGMTNQTAKFLDCDSSTISTIVREKSYDEYRRIANELPSEKKEKYLQEFIKVFDLENITPWIKTERLDDGTVLKIMCIMSCYGRGIEACILRSFDRKKGFIYHLMTDKSSYSSAKESYNQLSEDEIKSIGKEYFEKWNLNSYSKIKIKEQFQNLTVRYGLRI